MACAGTVGALVRTVLLTAGVWNAVAAVRGDARPDDRVFRPARSGHLVIANRCPQR